MTTGDVESISTPLLVIHIQALVLALGESVQPPWWKTEFMSKTGMSFLERLYPRSYYRAAVHAAGKAACEVHDRAVGRVGAYHLFRLPESIEIEIYSLAPSSDDEFTDFFYSCLEQPEKLMELLLAISAGEVQKSITPGPKKMGSGAALLTPEAFASIASVYQTAFKQGKPVYPYFTAE